MKTKFTKGPWELGEATSKHPYCIDAHCNNDGLRFELCEVLGADYEFEACEQSKANAHLIAAAPEMYEMLERLKKECQMFYDEFGEPSNPDYEAAFVEINALLAKARGEHE